MYFMPGGKLEMEDAVDKFDSLFGKLDKLGKLGKLGNLIGGDSLLAVLFLLPRLGKGVCISESIDG